MIEVGKNERVAHLVLDAPPVNVLDSALLAELTHELGRCADDQSLAAVLLRGKGRCFSAGASVEEHARDKAPAMLGSLLDACIALADLPVPAVALVHGPCLGGALELVSFCDVSACPRLRSRSSRRWRASGCRGWWGCRTRHTWR